MKSGLFRLSTNVRFGPTYAVAQMSAFGHLKRETRLSAPPNIPAAVRRNSSQPIAHLIYGSDSIIMGFLPVYEHRPTDRRAR